MFRPNWKMLLIGAAVAVSLTAGASTADAWWGHYRQACWSYTPYCAYYAPTVCYGCDCCCTPCCDPCCEWYLGYRPGPIRRALFGPYRWYSSGCGVCCGQVCGWQDCCVGCCTFDACCDEVASCATVEAKPAAPTPAEAEPQNGPANETTPALPQPTETPAVPATPDVAPPVPFDTPAAEPAGSLTPDSSVVPTPANSGLLTIWVPYDAKVTINGLATKSIGSRRQYVSYGLSPGFDYKYEVRAEVVRDGRVYEDLRTVTLTAGQRSAVAFAFNISRYEDLADAR